MQFEIKIIKINEFYLFWSSGVGPITYGMTDEAEVKSYMRREYGDFGKRVHEQVFKQAGWHEQQFDALGWQNEAGPRGMKLTKDQIYQGYCLRRPLQINGKEWRA